MAHTVVWTEEKKEKAIEALTAYYQKFGVGECISQMDDAQFACLDLVCDIADHILKNGEGIIYED